jgi:hypothetical protein
MAKISLALAVASVLLVASPQKVSATDSTDTEKQPSGLSAQTLSQLKGDYVLLVPGAKSASKPLLLPYEDFVSSYGVKGGNERIQGDDGGESVVPTPGPPGTDIGFEPGDTVIYQRTNGPWSRTVTYRYMGSSVWYMMSNVLKGPVKESES